jgi:acetylornithine deacetylase/succinyl-diaminopimelate desuccinylase-like protein
MEGYDKIYRHIDDHFDEHIKATQEILRQSSISLSDLLIVPEVVECGKMLVKIIKDLGGDAHLCEFKDGNPVVYGEIKSKNPKAKTIIAYSLYDVMPVEGEDWTTPPFAAEIVEAERINLPADFGKCIVARGVRNQKGPIMGFVNALKSMLAVNGDIPMNILFAFDGEEELGSPHFPEFRDRYADKLKKAEAAYYLNPSQDAEGKHHIYLGCKGILGLEISCEGGDWGGPKGRALFSADEVWIDPPAWRLIGALNTLKDQDGKVLIEGFYDNVRPSTPREKEMIGKLKDIFDDEKEKKRLEIKRWRKGLTGKDWLEKFVMSPLINIDGISGGYTGPRLKTMLPRKVAAKVDIRLVPDMDKNEILEKLRKHLDKHGFSDVQVRILQGCYNWSKTSADADIVKASITAARMFGVESYLWPTYYASTPTVAFSEPPLDLPVIGAGLGRMGRPHEVDEFFTVEGLRLYEKYVVAFLNEYAKL